MKKFLLLFSMLLMAINLSGQTTKIEFTTSFGVFKVMLYDYTPKHRQLLLDAIENKVYQEALFNRVIDNFVVQGGTHDDAIAMNERGLSIDQRQRLAPEFDARAFHKMGALGAGRDDNEQKASFLDQIYFVVGKSVTEDELKTWELKKGVQFTTQQYETYIKYGGLPRLDGDYTVFGEVIEGLDVLLTISKQQTNTKDAPLQDILFKIHVLIE